MLHRTAYAQALCAESTARRWFSEACSRASRKQSAEARCYVRTHTHGTDAVVCFSGQPAPAPDTHWTLGCILRGSHSERRAFTLILRALERNV